MYYTSLFSQNCSRQYGQSTVFRALQLQCAAQFVSTVYNNFLHNPTPLQQARVQSLTLHPFPYYVEFGCFVNAGILLCCHFYSFSMTLQIFSAAFRTASFFAFSPISLSLSLLLIKLSISASSLSAVKSLSSIRTAAPQFTSVIAL